MNNEHQATLRAQLLNEKHFFENLFTAHTPLQVRHVLNVSSEKQLQLLVKVIHLVSAGDIPLKQNEFDKIKKSKKLNFINNHFEREKDYKKVLDYSRRELITILYKIQSVIPSIVSPLLSNNE
jgi:hypothetical protein